MDFIHTWRSRRSPYPEANRKMDAVLPCRQRLYGNLFLTQKQGAKLHDESGRFVIVYMSMVYYDTLILCQKNI